jgi:hypothetical protein
MTRCMEAALPFAMQADIFRGVVVPVIGGLA